MTNEPLKIDHEAHQRLLEEAEWNRQQKAADQPERDRRRTKQTVTEIVEDRLASLQKLTDEALERRARLDSYVKTLKHKAQKCDRHGELRTLDVDQMSRDSRGDEWVLRWGPCRKCDLEARSEWLAKAGVPRKLLHCTLDNWSAKSQADKLNIYLCQQFTKRREGFLIITNAAGTPSKFGIGKSHLAVGILREISTGRFITQNDLMLRVRRRYDDRRQEDVLEACVRARCLVLDELGVGPGGNDELPTLHTLLSERYNRGEPTIITTNLSREEMFEYLGGRLESRIDSDTWKTIEVSGTDQRRKNQ
jgi:DNA replication protein DnaC